jgi:hypothetical protein
MKNIYQNHKYDRNIFKSKSEMLDEFLKNFTLFLKLPTLFWFFDWSMNIDYLLNSTALTGILILFYLSHLKK